MYVYLEVPTPTTDSPVLFLGYISRTTILT